MTKQSILELYRHMEWADACVWRAVLAAAGARTDPDLRLLLQHLHVVQRAFLRVWRGEPRETPYPTFDEASELMEWARTYYPEAYAFLDSVSDAEIEALVPVPWASMVEERIGRPPGETALGDTMAQVALHSQYHRGQINSLLRRAGGEPPLVDYIAWIWHGRPAADWPEEPASQG